MECTSLNVYVKVIPYHTKQKTLIRNNVVGIGVGISGHTGLPV